MGCDWRFRGDFNRRGSRGFRRGRGENGSAFAARSSASSAVKYVLIVSLLFSQPGDAQRRTSDSTESLLESGRAAKLSTPRAAPDEIAIVSYNIRWRSGAELKQISDWLKEHRPAIIALQEVDRAKTRTGNINNA